MAKQVLQPEEFMVLRTQVFTTYTQSLASQACMLSHYASTSRAEGTDIGFACEVLRKQTRRPNRRAGLRSSCSGVLLTTSPEFRLLCKRTGSAEAQRTVARIE